MKTLKHLAVTVLLPMISFGIGMLIQRLGNERAPVSAIFVLATYLVALLTPGYLYGLISAVIGVLFVNFAFTFPYFSIDFTIPENIVSAVVIIAVALITSALTTKIKNQETLRRETETERMRANLLRAVSHDLRTPLTTITSSSSAMIEHYDMLTDAQKLEMLRGIQEDSDWLHHMVENLLSVTRINEGAVTLIKTPTVLDELIDSVVVKFRKRFPAQEILLDIPQEILIIPMDPMLIEQVLMNLLENAVEHADGMTELKLSVRMSEQKAVFKVEDNGCGIAEEHLQDIFSGYYSGMSSSSDAKHHNTGIGLSVCATIIKAHGSTIRAENRPAGGAVLSFALDAEEIPNE